MRLKPPMRRSLPIVSLAIALTVHAPAIAQQQPQPASPDPDGNDEPVASASVAPLPAHMHFTRVGRPPHSLRRICALTAFHDSLFIAEANTPLGSDGAVIARYRPDDSPAFANSFDWNRAGQPATGGGGGQGFLRIRVIDGRLWVPDADPPYAGFGYVYGGTEGYVFVSDRDGRFAPPRGERLHPPGPPDANGRAGAVVLPRAYHVLDVIQFHRATYASTGSVPPGERPWYGASPGALHVLDARYSRMTYQADYPYPYQSGVWRLTFMVRFRGRLYAGIQDYDGREPNDFVVIDPPASRPLVTRDDIRGVRITRQGGGLTLRWFTDQGHLYWLGLEHDGTVALRVTDDGDHWRTIALPAESGRPVDLQRWRGALVVLTERALLRVDGATPQVLATVTEQRSPFQLTDVFCAPPLGVYRDALYVGGQRDGALYRVDGDAP
jgi:hypothetical protein